MLPDTLRAHKTDYTPLREASALPAWNKDPSPEPARAISRDKVSVISAEHYRASAGRMSRRTKLAAPGSFQPLPLS
jgi:hypothetical protein